MFELSFGKMVIIAAVALIVLGPERLPKVARTIGHLLGRARSYTNQVKQDIDREMQMDELRKLQQQAQDTARNFESAIHEASHSVEAQAADINDSVNQTLAAAESANSNHDDVANRIEPPAVMDAFAHDRVELSAEEDKPVVVKALEAIVPAEAEAVAKTADITSTETAESALPPTPKSV